MLKKDTMLQFWCQKVLPLVYDDSLSYYELLNKVVLHLNQNTENINQLIDFYNTFAEDVEDIIRQMIDDGDFNEIVADTLGSIIANEYDPEHQYIIFDYCIYNSKLYRANGSTTGEFDPEKWNERTVGYDLATIQNYIYTLNAGNVAYDPTASYDSGTVGNKIKNLNANDVAYDSSATYDDATVGKELINLNGAINDIEHQITNFIETEDTASQTYYKGTYLIWKGGLYRVIANVINQGDAFVVDTNIKSLTLESVLVTLTVPIAVSDEASLKRTSFNFFASAPIPLGSTGVTLETYAYGTVISSDGDSGMLFASGYNGNLYVAFLAGGVFVRAQIYDNRGTSITLTPDQTYVSSTTGINCKRTGNLVTFSGTIMLGASATTDNLLLSGFPAPTSDVDIFGTVIEATDSTQRGKVGRYRIKTNGTLVPWYNTWGVAEQGSIVMFNTSYII